MIGVPEPLAALGELDRAEQGGAAWGGHNRETRAGLPGWRGSGIEYRHAC
jgi:hypothetical protein